jgi:hypothetical protein
VGGFEAQEQVQRRTNTGKTGNEGYDEQFHDNPPMDRQRSEARRNFVQTPCCRAKYLVSIGV